MKRARHLILATRSEARQKLLVAAGFEFESAAADIDESLLSGETAVDAVRRLARAKAAAIVTNQVGAVVIAADTAVVVDAEIIGKPRDAGDARRMLTKLSGRWHDIYTGVAVRDVMRERTTVEVIKSKVRFKTLTKTAIEKYIQTGEPLSRAGAYALQGEGAHFIAAVRGSRTNVIGLPITTLKKMLDAMTSETEK